MHFELTVLGCNAALPANGRHPSAHILNCQDQLFLIDCGEGTQIQLTRYRVRVNRIRAIFISHLHGDHFFGLIGLLTSLSLNGRKKKLLVFSPPGLKPIIDLQFKTSGTQLTFELEFEEIEDSDEPLRIYESGKVEVFAFPLNHRIQTVGFLFREKPFPLNVDPERLVEYEVPVEQIPSLKAGNDFITPDGRQILNTRITLPPLIPRSFAYCSDTRFTESIIPWIKGADLLYHEATFAEEKRLQAEETGHSTAAQAATIARKAGVRALVIGHFSSRYLYVDPLLEEARAIFSETYPAEEGRVYSVKPGRRFT
jgi:ribonuclease Z